MKKIYATWKGYEVQVHSLSHLPGRVHVSTTDGSMPFTKYYAGAGCGMEAQGLVFVDSLENIRVVDDAIEVDPFDAGDCQPETEWEYDETHEYLMEYESLRRGG